jgi:hypothetical protein
LLKYNLVYSLLILKLLRLYLISLAIRT